MSERIVYVFGEPSRISIVFNPISNKKGYYEGQFAHKDKDGWISMCLKKGKRLLLSDGYSELLDDMVDGYITHNVIHVKNMSLFIKKKDCLGDVFSTDQAIKRMFFDAKGTITKVEDPIENVVVLTLQYPFNVNLIERKGKHARVEFVKQNDYSQDNYFLKEGKKIRLAISKQSHNLPRYLYDFNYLIDSDRVEFDNFIVTDFDSLFRKREEKDPLNPIPFSFGPSLYESVTYSTNGEFIKQDAHRVYVYGNLYVHSGPITLQNRNKRFIAETDPNIAYLLNVDGWFDNGTIKMRSRSSLKSDKISPNDEFEECLILEKGKFISDEECGGKKHLLNIRRNADSRVSFCSKNEMLSAEFNCIRGLKEAIRKNKKEIFAELSPNVELDLDSAAIFNVSVLKLDENTHLFVARLDFSSKKYANVFKPGNAPWCINDPHPSEHFMWNRWSLDDGSTKGTQFFFLSRGQEIHVIKYGLTSIFYYGGKLERRINYGMASDDMRLAEINGMKFVYGRDFHLFYEITVEIDDANLEKSVVELKTYIGRSRGTDINMMPIKIEMCPPRQGACYFSYLDWFYLKGVKISTTIYSEYHLKDIDYERITHKELRAIDAEARAKAGRFERYIKCKYPIVGTGSYDTKKSEDMSKFGVNYGIMPMFSLSTPYVKYGNYMLAVGHTKLHTDPEDYPYLEGSNIQKFRECIHASLENYYGDSYRKHLGTKPIYGTNTGIKNQRCGGYIYMMYFILLSDDLKTMYISDSYLPVAPKEKLDYAFSLFFPVGLLLEEDFLTVTGGYGDYYPMAVHFNINEVVKACRHDISELKMKDYKYYVV